MSMQSKDVPEQEQCGKLKRCYACKETSHSLDQCGIKYKLVTVAHEFGYATEYPFIMIHPSEEILEKEKFYHHCLLITSDVSNLDLGVLKVQLQKLWNLPGSWVLRRECSKSFLASLSSEGDVVSCLKNPNMEMLVDDKEVRLTVTRWSESEDKSNGLIKQWFLVCGVPRKYRGWAELYQVVSMFGVLIDVDERSLEVGDKDTIRLKIGLRNHDGAPLSYNYVVGRSSKMAMLTVEAKIDSENKDHNTSSVVTSTDNHVLDFRDSSEKEHEKEVINASQSILLEESMCINESRLDGKTKESKISTRATTVNNSKETTVDSSEPEGVQSICQNSTRMIGEDRFKGIPKPSIKYVFKRRGKKQQVTESTNISPLNKPNNGIGPESSNATRIGASEMERIRELNAEEIAPMGVSKESETCMDKEDNSATLAATINFKEKKISENSSKTERVPSVTMHKKVIVPRDEEVEACTEKEDSGATLSATTNSMEKEISKNSSKTERAQAVSAHTKVIVSRDEELKDIKQYYVKVTKEEMKLSKLYDILKTGKVVRNVIIFVNTKDKVMSLAQDVGKHYNVSATHDGMDQHTRDAAIQKFRSGSSSILIAAADLGGGGGGTVKVPVVINYDLPTQPMQYIHRVRQQTRQPGKKSVFVNLVTSADECVLFEIQRFWNGQVKEISDL